MISFSAAGYSFFDSGDIALLGQRKRPRYNVGEHFLLPSTLIDFLTFNQVKLFLFQSTKNSIGIFCLLYISSSYHAMFCKYLCLTDFV
jgi:hypothetical protein